MLNRCIFLLALFFYPGDRGFSSPLSILEQNCVRCHSPSKRKGGLLIDSRESLLKGGETGAAIVPGKSKDSYLVETLFPDAESHMPPKGQLKPREIEALENWINEGAKWDSREWATLTRPKKKELQLGAFPDLYSPVLAMALSPDGKWLASGRGSGIDLYGVVESEEKNKPVQVKFQKTLAGHSDVVQSLAFSPDGKQLASGGFRSLLIHDLPGDSAPKKISDLFIGRLTALSFSPDGKTLLAADSMPSQSAQIHFVDAGSVKVRHTVESAHDDTIFDLGWSADGKRFGSASADKLAIIRDAADYKILTTLEGHTSYVLSVAFSPDGKRIATGGDDEVIKVWDSGNGTQLSTFSTKNSGPVGGLTWVIDPDNLAKKTKEKDKKKAEEINTDRIVAINDIGQPGTFTDLNEHEGAQRSAGAKERRHDSVAVPLSAMAYDPERLILFAGSEDGQIFAWDKAGKKIPGIPESIEVTEVAK